MPGTRKAGLGGLGSGRPGPFKSKIGISGKKRLTEELEDIPGLFAFLNEKKEWKSVQSPQEQSQLKTLGKRKGEAWERYG